VLVTSASKWDTDDWIQGLEPKPDSGAVGAGAVYDWGSQGGTLRGCSNTVSMILRPFNSLTPLTPLQLPPTRPFSPFVALPETDRFGMRNTARTSDLRFSGRRTVSRARTTAAVWRPPVNRCSSITTNVPRHRWRDAFADEHRDGERV
jgi:hypothetical protein